MSLSFSWTEYKDGRIFIAHPEQPAREATGHEAELLRKLRDLNVELEAANAISDLRLDDARDFKRERDAERKYAGATLQAWSEAIDKFREAFRDAADYDAEHGGAWVINDSAYERACDGLNAAYNAALAKNPVNAEPSASTQSAGTMESALNPGPNSDLQFRAGMEAAAALCDEEVHSGQALLNEHPRAIDPQREAILGVIDTARGLGMTIRRFAADAAWRDEVMQARTEIVRPQHEDASCPGSSETGEAARAAEPLPAGYRTSTRAPALKQEDAGVGSGPVQRAPSSGVLAVGNPRAAVRDALGVDTSLDAYHNLDGALIDLRRMKADAVCVRTIERVLSQIAAVLYLVEDGNERQALICEHYSRECSRNPPCVGVCLDAKDARENGRGFPSQVRAQEGPIELAIWASDDGVEDNTEFVAQVSGPREMAMAEARRYAAPYAQDGDRVVIEEVTRREVEVIPSRRTAQVRVEKPKP